MPGDPKDKNLHQQESEVAPEKDRRLSRDNELSFLPLNLARLASCATQLFVPDRDSRNLLALVATMIMSRVQALLLARDRFHSL